MALSRVAKNPDPATVTYKCEDFQACLNQVFVLSADDYRDELELVQVDRVELTRDNGEQDAFTVVFQSSKPEPIPQQTYPLTNAQMGELHLFIVPIGRNDTGIRYEAVFS